MKIVEGAKVYQCEHCGKKSHHGSSLSRHERFCPKKPENQHQCFKYCKHLIKAKENLGGAGVTVFKCAAQNNKMLYSFKLEKSMHYGYGFFNPYFEGTERMPLSCPLFEETPMADLSDWG